MNFSYHKMDFRGTDDSKENGTARNADEAKGENGRTYYGCRNDAEESELKNVHNLGKDGPVTVSTKPGDVKNGDLVSLLLAATPPYLYNIPLIPQTFFFSEMLKSFVQAKTERQSMKAQQQTHHKRQRKRSWREMTPPKPIYYEPSDKPLELTTTPRQTDEKTKDRSQKRCQQIPDGIAIPEKKPYQSAEYGSSNFTAEKLANSSVTTSGNGSGSSSSNSNSPSESGAVGGDLLPPTPPLWYPSLYPPHPPFGIDPLHFFIDLRVSAHVWDRKLAADSKLSGCDPALSASSPYLRGEAKEFNDKCTLAGANEPSLTTRNRHRSAFTVPLPRRETDSRDAEPFRKRSANNVHYLMSNLKNIYRANGAKEDKAAATTTAAAAADETGETGKKCKDLRALIGLELVVDYVKQESDASDDEEQSRNVQVEEVSPDRSVRLEE